SWQRTVKQKITQSFEQGKEITFPPLEDSHGTEGPLVIEAEPLGQLKLLVTIGDATHSTKAWMNFMIVKSLPPYNDIIGRSGLKAIQAVLSTVHGMLKFPTEEGIVTIRSSLLIPAECASVDTSSVTPGEKKARSANLTVPYTQTSPIKKWWWGDRYPTKGALKHRLNVREGCPPVRQKKRGQAPERTKAIQAEVEKLIEAGIMREVYYHDWLSNPIMVKKHDGSWRMCVDFTDLNKACPHDCYPLPEIDWKVESLSADEEKTTFHTGHGVYCFTKMPFGLKNAGATYQRLMDKAFENQMGRNIEVYVDDLVVKSHTEAEMVKDMEETFQTLRKINMKLNPKKCSFGLAEGVFIGPDDRTGDSPDASLLYKPCVTGSETKLLTDGKTDFITGLCSKKTSKIFSGISYHASNNEAEYEALIVGLRIATQIGVKNIQANVDSKLVANQVLGTYIAKEDNMIKYLNIAKGLVLVEVLETKSITAKEVTAVIEEEGPTWMTKLVNYLKEKYIMKEIREGSCSMYAGPRSVVAKAIRLGYFWPTMHKDAQDMIRKCSDCQIHRPVTRHPQQPLTPITAPWPFYKWGIDIAGPFSEGPGKVKFLIVAMDYFTKWIEAKAVATITGRQVKKFVWDNIVCRFGIPGEIISDNGKQFANNPFKDWCDKLNITQHFASVKHPQSNGLVERANRSLGEV
nr:reverse transcriptase domain-containing protein [Tanacetum cinerariifolium]